MNIKINDYVQYLKDQNIYITKHSKFSVGTTSVFTIGTVVYEAKTDFIVLSNDYTDDIFISIIRKQPNKSNKILAKYNLSKNIEIISTIKNPIEVPMQTFCVYHMLIKYCLKFRG